MQASRLFGKYYLITAAIVISFIVVGFYMSRQILKLTAQPTEGRHFIYEAKIIAEVDPQNRPLSVDKLNALDSRNHFELTDAPPNFSADDVYKFKVVAPNQAVILLPGTKNQILKVKFEGPGGNRIPWVLIHGLTALIISILLGIAFAMVIIFRLIEQKVVTADTVIEELKSGNLKARFEVGRDDEMGRAMTRFNRMADEIERLVERLRSTEKARVLLLQELAHDLRTPVASLKNLIETVSKPAITKGLREELFALSLKEVEYFERLVEDLLILAQVSEPRYDQKQEGIDFADLIKEEVSCLLMLNKTKSPEKNISITQSYPPEKVEVKGDVHLLRRMIRNGLENANSFAKSNLRLLLVEDIENQNWKFTVEDDGPGFSPEILSSFGERRLSRVLSQSQANNPTRLSVGLGSVILKTVAHVHGGSVQVENLKPENRSGARLTICIPKSKA